MNSLDRQLIANEIEKYFINHHNEIPSLINLTVKREGDGFSPVCFKTFNIDKSSIKATNMQDVFTYEGSGTILLSDLATAIRSATKVKFGGFAKMSTANDHIGTEYLEINFLNYDLKSILPDTETKK